MQKVSMSSLAVNLHSLPDVAPVYPIWTNPGHGADFGPRKTKGGYHRISPFAPSRYYPKPKSLKRILLAAPTARKEKRLPEQNPTTIRQGDSYITPGVYIDVVEGRVLATSAEDASNDTNSKGVWESRGRVPARRKPLFYDNWFLVHTDEYGDDPVLQLLALIMARRTKASLLEWETIRITTRKSNMAKEKRRRTTKTLMMISKNVLSDTLRMVAGSLLGVAII
ncbi:unnamed protein product [Zymoseptoria tritici ST99CH_1E4]|uniref:Uncharacterized protein n=1 Tax=Zymoseptoria tritici ST99CH_1E4 TaxID=1276532 RepID=A0A2H1GQB9_ZYMTR|nr:unnamed protein product [Zymoseptoria tritici ST99CH_1E4]